jgi:CRP-like cAMP-binding protein
VVIASPVELLRGSPLLEGLADEHVERLARGAHVETFPAGEDLFRAGEPAHALYLLVTGRVRLTFAVAGDEPEPTHTLSHPGEPLGWSAVVEPHRYRATATALVPTSVVALDRARIEAYAEAHPEFGVAFMRRILWLVGGRLRAARMGLVARRYGDEVRAVRALLEQTSSSLSVQSPLHRIPHHLQHRLTLADAFHVLDLIQDEGDEVEREVAGVAADLLEGVRAELAVFQSLQTIYELVASAGRDLDPAELRRASAERFLELFAQTTYVVRGEEHLPERPGHVVVMNHLSNHVDNLLPNDFILTLDTHFVSARLLYAKYGEAPIRVIRRSRPEEHGHRRFYDRLGYLYVEPASVDDHDAPPEQRRLFFDAARAHLRAGRNVVICPEGASTSTARSPLPFKTGAFHVAAGAKPEPYVVPVAVAHFDAKITRTTPVAVVHEPFRLSEVLRDPNDHRALRAWIDEVLHPRYVRWVREAAALSG